ncbi:MAG: DUF2029 domain-containing protein [Kiritimatiellae bacterium]|nr:DUF2029 domain-containing protein [Kiritimatiellia bacterium]
MKRKFLYCCLAIPLFLLPVVRIAMIVHKGMWLVDFLQHAVISKTLFRGINPFPDNIAALNQAGVFDFSGKELVPIAYPGQMPLFAWLGYCWSESLQIAFIALNVALSYVLIGLTLVRGCGFQWHDLFSCGRRQLAFGACCLCFFSSASVMNAMRSGQIVILLAFCLYAMFWCRADPSLGQAPSPPAPLVLAACACLFAFAALAKYSVLTVLAPLLFFKGYRKLCVSAFLVFLLFSVSPAFRGNDLAEVYSGYSKAVGMFLQPGQSNHFGMNPVMCHLDFFRFSAVNLALKAVAAGAILWLLLRESKNRRVTDTLLLAAFCLTMLVSYHGLHDLILLFPLLFIRLVDFARTRRWKLFWITLAFPLVLDLPGRTFLRISSWIGSVPRIGSAVYLVDNPFHSGCLHVFPLAPVFMIALTVWSLYLYLKVENPYGFELPR